jgi:predicted deacylase
VARSSTWVRAPISGILRVTAVLGARIHKNDVLGRIADPFGEKETEVTASAGGIIIGKLNLPLVNEGDALFHIARFEKVATVAARVEEFHSNYEEHL